MNFTVALVDDDEIILLLHKRIMEISNFHQSPQIFNSAKKSLNLFANLRENAEPVLLFLDINMPDMNGWDLLDIIHRDHLDKNIYVVMVTSSIDLHDKEKAFTYPKVIDFISKPFMISLLKKIHHELPWIKMMESKNI